MLVPKMDTKTDPVVGKQFLEAFNGTGALYVNIWLVDPVFLPIVTDPKSLSPVPLGNLDFILLSLTQLEAEFKERPIEIFEE